jgi:hypothetical protein
VLLVLFCTSVRVRGRGCSCGYRSGVSAVLGGSFAFGVAWGVGARARARILGYAYSLAFFFKIFFEATPTPYPFLFVVRKSTIRNTPAATAICSHAGYTPYARLRPTSSD